VLIVDVFVFTWYHLYVPDYPEGTLSEKVTYTINPQTILASLERGETNVFQSAPPEPDGAWPILWASSSFVWNQEDYMKVASALHLRVWGESLDNWKLIRATFNIDRCQDIFMKIDSVSLSFFQRQEGWNNVHGFWINPTYGIVTAGNEYSHRAGWRATWNPLNFEKIRINNVDAALLAAEENGGEEARLAANNECNISLILAPDRFEYNILSHPLKRYSWGWSIIYWLNEPNKEPIFSINVDPYTEEIEIMNSSQ
jgi:hypothetical protein